MSLVEERKTELPEESIKKANAISRFMSKCLLLSGENF
jgi:hypothetical protein